MAEGVRIRHPNEVSCVFTIVSGRPYLKPFECPQCRIIHPFKTYHINLDSEGSAIVSQEVWEKLTIIPNQPFERVNTVESPPSRTLALGFAGSAKIIGQYGKEIRHGNP